MHITLTLNLEDAMELLKVISRAMCPLDPVTDSAKYATMERLIDALFQAERAEARG